MALPPGGSKDASRHTSSHVSHWKKPDGGTRGHGLWILLADAARPPSFSIVIPLVCTHEPWQRRCETKERLCVDWIRLQPSRVHANKHTNQLGHLLPMSYIHQGCNTGQRLESSAYRHSGIIHLTSVHFSYICYTMIFQHLRLIIV